MAAGLTQELGQPLHAIADSAKGAARCLRIPEHRELETLGTLEKIATEAHLAADLIGRIRRFARVGDGVAQPLDFEAVLSRSLELCEAEVRSRDFTVRTRVEVAGPSALGDPQEWSQIIINLIVNALEAGEGLAKERRIVDVEVLASETSPWVTLVIEDRGTGIDPTARQWIFEPFRTSKPQWLGLGLSITRTLVEAHRGTIEIQTGRFGGARFVIRLPRPLTASAVPLVDTFRPASVLPAGGSHVEESR